MERDSTEITFENDGTSLKKASARVRIQSDAGVQRYAVLTLAYQSSSETVDIDYVRVLKPDATVIVTPPENVQDMASEIAREAPLYSDSREKHIAVKGLGVGDVLEFAAEWHTKPLAPGQFWFAAEFSRTDITLQETFQVGVPRERAVKWSSPKSKPVIAETDKRRIFTWTNSQLEHKSKEQEEKDTGTLNRQAARGRVPEPEIQLSSFQTWEEIGRWYNSLQVERVKPTPEIRAKAADLTKGLTGDDAKARAIYAFVNSQIHYVGIDLGIGRYQPHAAGEVLANQYGDCKDKHTLLASLLDAVGIQAYPVLIGAGHELVPDVPSPAQFDHLITAVSMGGRLPWLDTTPEVAPFGYLLGVLRGKKALVVSSDKPPALIDTPADPPAKGLETFRIDAKLSDSGTLEGKIERSIQNDDTEILLRTAFRRIPSAQWKDLAQQVSYLSGFSGDTSAVSANPDKTEEPFHLTYSYTRKDYPDWANRRVGSPLPPAGLPGVPDDDPKPIEPVWLGSPMEQRYESHVELPKGYRPTLPRNVDLTNKFAEYHRVLEFKDGVLTTQRTLLVKSSDVPVSEYADYKKFVREVTEDVDLKVPVWSGKTSAASYQDEIWALPYSPNADATKAYNDAVQKYNEHDMPGQLAAVKRAVEIDPKFTRAWLWLGEIYQSRRQLDDAVKAYRKAIEVEPQQPVGYKALGFTLSMMQNPVDAITVWNQLIKLAPGDRTGPIGLGMSLMVLKRYADAESAFESAAQIDPDDVLVQSGLGKASLLAGHADKARAAYKKTLELSPEPLTMNNIAYDLAEANQDLPLALEYAKKAVTGEGEASRKMDLSQLRFEDLLRTMSLASFWDTLGWVYFKTGDLDEAERYLKDSWTLSQIADVADHLGQVYERRNQKQAAIRMYKFALSRMPLHTPSGKTPDAVRARLERLSPTDSGNVRKDMETASELSKMRTTKLALTVPGEVSADFFLVFARDPKTAAVGVEDTKFISGSDELKSAGAALKATDFKITIPSDGDPRVLRRGILVCAPRAGCFFTLLNPTDVQSLN